MNKKPIYLDYAAATPLDPAVFDAMKPYLGYQSPVAGRRFRRPTNQLTNQPTVFGNPGSLHSFGQQASAAVFTARQMIAKELNCHYSEVIFTGSATEANNLALRGALKASRRSSVASRQGKSRIIISAIEHESVLQTARDLESDGVEVVVVPVSHEGIIDLKKLKAALSEQTVLVSIMYANNEVGSIQPIAEVAQILRDFRSRQPTNQLANQPTLYPLLHTDAVQAFQYLFCDVQALGVDLLTLSAHKIYGPKGIGALYVRSAMKGVQRLYPVAPITTGGGQEFGLRSGTENVANIVGFAKAVSLVAMEREDEAVRVGKLRNDVWQGIRKIFPKAQLNGPNTDIPTFSRMSECRRLPNNVNFYIPLRQSSGQAGVPGEQLLVALDLHGVAVSSGSACAARSIDPSHVILALGYDAVRAKNSLRVSLGVMTTKQEIQQFLVALKKVKSSL